MPVPGTRGARRRRQRPSGLRRRLTLAFAFVALAAVGLTTWLTLGAVFEAQRELFEPIAPQDRAPPPSSEGGHFGPPWWMGAGRWWADESGGPPWDDPGFVEARRAFLGVSRTAFLAAVFSFLLAVAAAALLTRFLTRPLAALTEGAERLGAGERGIRLALPASRDELRRLTEAFNDLVAGLERQEAWRRDMVADVAHDLRTPLSVMRSEIEALQDGVTRVDTGSLERLHGEVMMMARLVEDLRALSLAESEAQMLELQETDVRPFLQALADSFSLRADQARVEVVVSSVPDGLHAVFDRQRIRQLLGNLIDNAIKHAGSGSVELGARQVEDGLHLWVRDHGPGLAEESTQRVFERFYRSDESRTRMAGSGTGLGLAIAKALAEAHGGRIEASNHREGGALFSVWLPDAKSTS